MFTRKKIAQCPTTCLIVSSNMIPYALILSQPFPCTIASYMVDYHTITICILSGMSSLKGIIKKFGMASLTFLFIFLVTLIMYYLVKIVILKVDAIDS